MPSDFVARPPYNVIQPGTYSAVDASQLTAANDFLGHPIPAIIGVCQGGVPASAGGLPLFFQSPGQMQSVLRGGPAYDVARFALGTGAPQVCVCRIGNSITQSSLTLAGTGNVVVLTSLDYGVWTTGITVVTTATSITLKYTDPLGNVFTESWSWTDSPTPAQIAARVNGTAYGYNASNFVSAVAGTGTGPLTVISSTPLAGGTDGSTPIAGDWTTGLTALENQAVDLIVPASGSASVHAQVLTHCQNMSAPNAKRERAAVVGGVLSENVATVIARTTALQSARVQLVYPGMQDFNASGVVTLYDPFYLAGKIAGMHAALPDAATSLTHAIVPVVGVETVLSTVQGGAVDTLLYAGISPLVPTGNVIRLIDSLSLYNLPDFTFRDFHKTRSADYVAQFCRSALQTQFVGGKSLTGTAAQIKAAALNELQILQNAAIIRAFLVPDVTAGPGISGYSVTLPVMLVDTTKFIFITVALQPSATVITTAGTTAQGALS